MKKNTGSKINRLVPLAKKFGKYAIALVMFLILLNTFPVWWCQRHADSFYSIDFETSQQLADGAFEQVEKIDLKSFDTGSDRFDGEWLFGSNTMTAMGNAQLALQYPKYRETAIKRMKVCFDNLLSETVQSFDSRAWRGHNALASIDDDRKDHAAYLGYLNLPLSLYNHIRTNLLGVIEKDKYQVLNVKITAALARRMQKHSTMLLETYPGEYYPVDNTACAASIAVYNSAFGGYEKLLEKWQKNFRIFIDEKSGMLIQSVDAGMTEYSFPRGSGTSLAAYFLTYLDPYLAKELYRASRDQLLATYLGFALMREYPEEHKNERGDIDSGPLILGYSMSTTGFSLASAKTFQDRDTFDQIFATAWMAGAPEVKDGKFHWKTGGPLGDAILFAMLTVPTDFKTFRLEVKK